MTETQLELDAHLDRYLPAYDVVERHSRNVRAPVAVAWDRICKLDLEQVWVVHLLIRARELLLHAQPAPRESREGFLPRMQAMGWGLLAQTPGREIIMGAATQPWLADVKFRPLPPGELACFAEPGYARIVWAIRVEAATGGSVVQTQTRVATTDATAGKLFRAYWRRIAPGVRLIRHAMLRSVQREAERDAGR